MSVYTSVEKIERGFGTCCCGEMLFFSFEEKNHYCQNCWRTFSVSELNYSLKFRCDKCKKINVMIIEPNEFIMFDGRKLPLFGNLPGMICDSCLEESGKYDGMILFLAIVFFLVVVMVILCFI